MAFHQQFLKAKIEGLGLGETGWYVEVLMVVTVIMVSTSSVTGGIK